MCTLFIGLKLRSDIGSVASSPPPSSSPDMWQLPSVLGFHSSHHPPGKSTTFNSGILKPLFLPPEHLNFIVHTFFPFLFVFVDKSMLRSNLEGKALRPVGDNGMHSLIDNDYFKNGFKGILQHAKLGHLSKIPTHSVHLPETSPGSSFTILSYSLYLGHKS